MWRFLALFLSLPLLLPLQAEQEEHPMIETIGDLSGLTISTPVLAEAKRAKLRLRNGLEVYLISDPEAPESGAALSMEAGSWQDPDDALGLAHFVEHLLFLGNAKYPEENGFRRYLEAHGGHANAYTTDLVTNYMFKVDNEGFPLALDRFAHLFIDPNFNQDAMGRELHAVSQEFERSIEHDGWRKEMLSKALCNPDHPFSRFSCGNFDTLGKVTSEKARNWFEAHYSANLAHLVIISSLPLQELEEIVQESFRDLPNRELSRAHFTQAQYGKKGEVIFLKPHRSLRQLTIGWELPYDHRMENESHAAQLIAFTLGHEGEGSLLSLLRKEGSALGLSVGCTSQQLPQTSYQECELSIQLTPEGVANWEEVVERVFGAIYQLKKMGIPRTLYEEYVTLVEQRYAYQTRKETFKEVSSHAYALCGEELATYPRKSLLPSHYDRKAITKQLAHMGPDRARILILAQPSETHVRHTRKEPYMGSQYARQPLNEARLALWKGATPPQEFSLPKPNPYIPESFEKRYAGLPSQKRPLPLLIRDDEGGQLYYAQDQRFGLPHVAHQFAIRSALMEVGDPTSIVLGDLLVSTLNEELAECCYTAQLAGLQASLGRDWAGIRLGINGFSDKSTSFLSTLFVKFRQAQPTEELYQRHVERLSRSYKDMARETPAAQVGELARQLLYADEVSMQEKAKALEHLTYAEFLSFAQHWLDQSYVQGVLYGNLSQPEAEEIALLIREGLQSAPWEEGGELHREVVQLPQERGPYCLGRPLRVQGNASLLLIDQGSYSPLRGAAQELLGVALEEPFFTELRTQQQTGYHVQSWSREIERRLFAFFLVQSTTHDARDLLSRYEHFLEGSLRNLQALCPKDRFQAIRTSLVNKHAQLPKTPAQQSNELMALAFTYDGEFDWVDKQIEGLRSITYEEFCSHAEEFFSKGNKGRLAILGEGKLTPGESLRYRNARSCDKVRKLCDYRPRYLVKREMKQEEEKIAANEGGSKG